MDDGQFFSDDGPAGGPAARPPVPDDFRVHTLRDDPEHFVASSLGPVLGIALRPRTTDIAMLTRARQEAVAAMTRMARETGADAVIGMRFDSTDDEIVAYGTAVVLEDDILDPDSEALWAAPERGRTARGFEPKRGEPDPRRDRTEPGQPGPEQPARAQPGAEQPAWARPEPQRGERRETPRRPEPAGRRVHPPAGTGPFAPNPHGPTPGDPDPSPADQPVSDQPVFDQDHPSAPRPLRPVHEQQNWPFTP